MRNHSVTIRGHATSISMEDEFWESVKLLAREKEVSLAGFIADVDAKRPEGQNLSSALRLAVLAWWKQKAGEKGLT